MRILLVDDEPELLSAVGQWLQHHGHRPVTLSDSRDVMRMLELQHFDLICLDVLLPYIDGLQLIRRIHESSPECPILVLSGVDDTRIVVEAVKEGAEDCLQFQCQGYA